MDFICICENCTLKLYSLISESTQSLNNNFSSFNLDSGHPREFDAKFHGPIEKRSCTDVICLLMLVAFIIGWCIVAVIGKT